MKPVVIPNQSNKANYFTKIAQSSQGGQSPMFKKQKPLQIQQQQQQQSLTQGGIVQTIRNKFGLQPFQQPNYFNKNEISERGNRLKEMTKHSNQGTLNLHRISKDIKSTHPKQTKKDKDIVKNLNYYITRIQANFRRRRQQKIYKPMAKLNRYRKAIYQELIDTEKGYVEDLKIIIDIIIAGLSEFMTKEEKNKAFANINSIRQLNEQMLSVFLPWDPHKKLVTVLLEYAPYFKMYFEYCNNYTNLMAIITRLKSKNEKFSVRIADIEKKSELRRMEIFSFFVKPIQRLPKYVLLLKDYLKHTDKMHEDYQNIILALNKFSEVNDDNNAKMDKVMTNAKMFELQKLVGEFIQVIDPKRDFKAEEPMTIFWRRKERSVIVYFFSDLLIATERNENSKNSEDTLRYVTSLSLSETSDCYLDRQSGAFEGQYLLRVVGADQTWTFIITDLEIQTKIQKLISSIIENLKQKDQKRQEALDKLQPRVAGDKKKKKFRIEVQTIGSEERNDGIKNNTVYIIRVKINGIVDTITLRFSEMIEAQNMVKKSFPKLNLPYFSDKNILSNHTEKVIEQRKILSQDFFQSLLGSEAFYDQQDQNLIQKLQAIIKYIGLPINFYQLPELLSQDTQDLPECEIQERTSSYSRKGSFSKQAMSSSESLVQTLSKIDSFSSSMVDETNSIPMLSSLPDPDSMATYQQQSRYGAAIQKPFSKQGTRERPISASKLLASKKAVESQIQQKNAEEMIILIKLSNDEIKLTINDETRALNIYSMISQKIGLKQTYDYKLVEPKQDRIIQDDELVINLFRKKQAEGLRGLTREFTNKVKGLFSDVLHYRKILFLPREIEVQEFLSDNVRLDLLYSQILNDILNLNKIQLTFREYSMLAAIQVYRQSLTTRKIDNSIDNLKKFIPELILKSTNKDIWAKEINLIMLKLESMISYSLQDKPQQETIAKQVTVNLLLENKLYGMTMFQGENMTGFQSQTTEIPAKFLIGINLEGIHIIDPKRKTILATIYGGQIEKINIQTNIIQLLVEDEQNGMKSLKFQSNQAYQIYFLYEEYQDILFEIDLAYSSDQLQ